MTKVICHVPVKIRLVGEPSEEVWAALEERLAAQFTRALRRSLETLDRKRPKEELVEESYQSGRDTAEGYLLPSYQGGGTATKTPIVPRRSSGPLKLTGEDTNDNVVRLLHGLGQRFPRLRNVSLGRINGSTLDYGDSEYRLSAFPPLAEGVTVSRQLGEGVFWMRSIPRQTAGLAALVAGGAYEFLVLDAQGQDHATGLRVIAVGLPELREGILVYSARTQYLRETVIAVRRPRDVVALARRGLAALDIPLASLSPGTTALEILVLLQQENLTPEETMALLEEVRRLGRLGDFLNLVRSQNLRDYLKRQGVEWSYILSNWESSLNDSAAFFAGYMIGAAESVYDGFRLIGMLIGSVFSQELARERARLWQGLRQFFAHPIMNSVQGLEQLRHSFEGALWDLDFFKAGRITGNIVVLLLTLPEAIRSLPRAAQGLVKVGGAVARLTLRAIEQLGVSVRVLAEFVNQPARALALPSGILLMKIGDEIEVIDQSGHVAGRVVPREFTPADIAEWEKALERALQERAAPKEGTPAQPAKPVTTVPAFLDLEDLVSRAITRLRGELGPRWLPNSQFGTRLHKVVEELISAAGGTPSGWRVFTETPFRQLVQMPEAVAKLTLREYVAARPHLREFLRLPADLLESQIGDLRPDLVIFEPNNTAIVWDLTARSNLDHLAKTQLYAYILHDPGKIGMVRFGETYWTQVKGQPSVAAILPAAGAAARTDTKPEP